MRGLRFAAMFSFHAALLSNAFAQNAAYDGVWEGTYECGAVERSTSEAGREFRAQVRMTIGNSNASLIRETARMREALSGKVSGDGELRLEGLGEWKVASNDIWRTRFVGRIAEGRFAASGTIESTDGKRKWRDCQLKLAQSGNPRSREVTMDSIAKGTSAGASLPRSADESVEKSRGTVQPANPQSTGRSTVRNALQEALVKAASLPSEEDAVAAARAVIDRWILQLRSSGAPELARCRDRMFGEAAFGRALYAAVESSIREVVTPILRESERTAVAELRANCPSDFAQLGGAVDSAKALLAPARQQRVEMAEAQRKEARVAEQARQEQLAREAAVREAKARALDEEKRLERERQQEKQRIEQKDRDARMAQELAQQREHQRRLLVGEVPVTSIADAVLVHKAIDATSIVVQPPFAADKRTYLAYGQLRDWENAQGDVSGMHLFLGSQNDFYVLINRETKFLVEKSGLRQGHFIHVVGIFADTAPGVGRNARVPVFIAKFVGGR